MSLRNAKNVFCDPKLIVQNVCDKVWTWLVNNKCYYFCAKMGFLFATLSLCSFFPCIIISLCLYYVLHAFPLVISCIMIMCLYCIIPCLSKQEFSFYLSIKMAWTCCEILKNNDLKNLIMFGIVCNTNVSKIICIKKDLKNPCDFRPLSWV